MTKDEIIEIIEMAKQAGARVSSNPDEYDVLKITDYGLVAFAKLVAEKEREAIIDIVAMYGGSVEIEAAIRARGEA